MFANVCSTCGKRELVFADQIRGLAQTATGFDVRYECTCGAGQVWHVDRVHADVEPVAQQSDAPQPVGTAA
jgi:hypothetical protein